MTNDNPSKFALLSRGIQSEGCTECSPEEKPQGNSEAQRVGERNQQTGDSHFDNRSRGTRTILGDCSWDCSVTKDKGTSKETERLVATIDVYLDSYSAHRPPGTVSVRSSGPVGAARNCTCAIVLQPGHATVDHSKTKKHKGSVIQRSALTDTASRGTPTHCSVQAQGTQSHNIGYSMKAGRQRG